MSRLAALGGVLRWDPARDLACLHYPPFGQPDPAHREAFLWGYGPEPKRKRLLLYAVMQRLSAAAGSYMAPKTARNGACAQACLMEPDLFLEEIEGLS